VIRRAVTWLLASALLSAVLTGCGLGPGEDLGGASELRVTRDFGTELLASASLEQVRDGETVMRFLRSERDVETRYGGGFVQSIDGLEGGGAAGQVDWFYFVNGLEAETGAAERALAPGDVVQWDYRDWGEAMSVPAIVGAYPEPFVHGLEGKRLPTRVECEDDSAPACEEVKRRLTDAGVNVTSAPLGAAAGSEVLRVIVAPYEVARRSQAGASLERGPGESGVFARFGAGGATLELLDQNGEVASTAGPGAGLVAAAAPPGERAVWLVTGVDDAGVEAAARLLDEATLRDAFAVAATPEEGPVTLPVVTP